jgi:predicted transcriptional regulator
MADAPKSSSIRDKFGIDYLITGNSDTEVQTLPSPASNLADPLIERALAVHGTRILTMLQEEGQRSVHDMVDRTGLNMETVMGVVDRMVRTGLVQITQQDKYGNHTIQITPTGEQLLKQE